MYCVNCGNEIQDGHLFCVKCGAKVTNNAEPQEQPSVTASVAPQEPPQMQPVWQTSQPAQPTWQAQPMQPQQVQTQPMRSQPMQPQQSWQQPQQMQPQQSWQQPQQSLSGWQARQMQAWQMQALRQRDTFYVKKLPMVVIAILTIFLFVSSFFVSEGSMTIASLLSSIPGLVLLILIYKTDKIEPEPIPLLIKLFCCGGILVPFWVIIVEGIVGFVNSLLFGNFPIIYSVVEAFLVAATCEELGKYFALRLGSWKHPAFNYRFDGVVYSTTVALGFDIVENILYLTGAPSMSTALGRAAFPGHCIFGIYMGYYYGQAKSLELRGDKKGSLKLRLKGIFIAILIHGFYDTICFMLALTDNDLMAGLAMLFLLGVMIVLNVTAYKNLKTYAHEDRMV